MRDVQSGPAEVALRIDRVGVKNLSIPLTVRDRAKGRLHTVARVDLSVDLPARFKGTHMSRFLEALRDMDTTLDADSCKNLCWICAIACRPKAPTCAFFSPTFWNNAPRSLAAQRSWIIPAFCAGCCAMARSA